MVRATLFQLGVHAPSLHLRAIDLTPHLRGRERKAFPHTQLALMNFHKRQVLCFGGKVFPNDTALRRPRARPPFPHDSAGQCVTAVGSPSGTHNPVVRGLGRVVGPHRGPTTVTRRRRPFGAAPPPVPPPISDCALRRAPRRHRGARRAARRRKSRVPCMPRRRARPQATRGSRARARPGASGPRPPGPRPSPCAARGHRPWCRATPPSPTAGRRPARHPARRIKPNPLPPGRGPAEGRSA